MTTDSLPAISGNDDSNDIDISTSTLQLHSAFTLPRLILPALLGLSCRHRLSPGASELSPEVSPLPWLPWGDQTLLLAVDLSIWDLIRSNLLIQTWVQFQVGSVLVQSNLTCSIDAAILFFYCLMLLKIITAAWCVVALSTTFSARFLWFSTVFGLSAAPENLSYWLAEFEDLQNLHFYWVYFKILTILKEHAVFIDDLQHRHQWFNSVKSTMWHPISSVKTLFRICFTSIYNKLDMIYIYAPAWGGVLEYLLGLWLLGYWASTQ